MDRLLLLLMSSKAMQKYAFLFVVIIAVGYLAPVQYRQYIIVIAVVIVLAIWAYTLFIKGVGSKMVSSFEKGLSKDMNASAAGGKVSSRQAQAELATRWNAAVAELKKAKMSLYSLPWYLLIGEPQSGKSTTLKNSGLEFPVGTEALSGAGGTRNCDWWFTNEAVILDTAGRFTFQEKNAPDSSEWKTFLQLLRKRRPKTPINGVILVIPCTTLLSDSDEVRDQKAVNIREKLQQLQRELGVQFPVFVLITKSDQILGFTEFFSRLQATEQRQILGWSMPGPFIQAFDPTKFNEVFDAIHERIHKLRLKLLGEDLPLTEVDKLFVLPEEFRSLREPLHDYLKSIFVKTQFLPPLFFRGFYFTSGLQEGTPIARACADMIRNAGEGAGEIIENLAKVFSRSKAFFIRDFYTDKLFQEREMVIHSVKEMGVNRKLGLAAIALSFLLILATGGYLAWNITQLKKGIGGISDIATKVRKEFGVATQENRSLDANTVAIPPTFGPTADAIKTSSDFTSAIKASKGQIPLQEELRDMHWLYFMQNVLAKQGRTLYAHMITAGAGQSKTGLPAAPLYDKYAKAWSVNADWLVFTQAGKGQFPRGKELAWGPLLHPDGAKGEIDPDLQKAFDSELAVTTDALNETLEFDEKVDPSSVNPPVQLNIVPGSLNPRANFPVKREIEAVSDQFKTLDPQQISNLAAAAAAAKALYEQSAPRFAIADCGYKDLNSDPFTDARAAAQGVLDAFKALKDLLGQNSQITETATLDEASIRKAFDQLGWTKQTSGRQADQVEAYIQDQTKTVLQRMREQAQRAREPLKGIEDIIEAGATLQLTMAAQLTLEGLDHLVKLGNAHKIAVSGVVARSIASSDEIPKIVTEWTGNPVRAAALDWGTQNAAKPNLPPQWKINELANIITTAITNGDEAVLVESWLHYVQGAAPVEKLTSAQIASASLASDPPEGATWQTLAADDEKLVKLIGELTAFKDGVTCEISNARVRAALDALAGTQKNMRASFLNYWKNGYANWNPYSWIRAIPTWEAFHANDLMQNGKLAERTKAELTTFVDNVGNYQDTMKGALGDLLTLYKNLSASTSSGSVLEANCNEFTDTVSSMPPKTLDAYLALDKPGPSGKTNRKSLTTIAKDSKFAEYPKKVFDLLSGAEAMIPVAAAPMPSAPVEAVPDAFQTELSQFLADWTGKLADKFPFDFDKGKIGTQVTNDVNSVSIPQADILTFKEFFFSDKGLQGFLARFGPAYEPWSKKPENAGVREFIDSCLKLRDFFFDGQNIKTQNLKGTYTGFAVDGKKQAGEDLRGISEDIEMLIPKAPAARWRSRVDQQPSDFKWAPGDYGDRDMFEFASKLERGDAKSQNTARLRVPGDFSVLAYIYGFAVSPSAGRQRWDNVTFSVVPKFAGGGAKEAKSYKVTFNFELAQPLPPLPNWDAVKQWLKK